MLREGAQILGQQAATCCLIMVCKLGRVVDRFGDYFTLELAYKVGVKEKLTLCVEAGYKVIEIGNRLKLIIYA